MLGLAAALIWREGSLWRLGLYLWVFAVTAETLQLLSVDRTFHPADAGLNLLGVTIGLTLGSIVARRWGSKARPINAEE